MVHGSCATQKVCEVCMYCYFSLTTNWFQVSGKPIKLVGRGERMEDLEPFYPDRMAGRILGMGDVLSFVEKAQEVVSVLLIFSSYVKETVSNPALQTISLDETRRS